jgi:hypothetical protein
MMDAKELDVQIQRRIMHSDIAVVPEYASSLVDFKVLFDHLQQNWTYSQKRAFREELEARLKRPLPIEPGILPRWRDLMSLKAGDDLPKAGCEAALAIQGSVGEDTSA